MNQFRLKKYYGMIGSIFLIVVGLTFSSCVHFEKSSSELSAMEYILSLEELEVQESQESTESSAEISIVFLEEEPLASPSPIATHESFMDQMCTQQQSQPVDIVEQLQTIAQYEQMIVDVQEKFVETIRLANLEYELFNAQQIASYLEEKPRAVWETESEYNNRIQAFETQQKKENVQKIKEVEAQRDVEISQLTNQMNNFKKNLSSHEFTISADMTTVEVLPFDAAGKFFPIRVTSKHDELPFVVTINYKITEADYDAISVTTQVA